MLICFRFLLISWTLCHPEEYRWIAVCCSSFSQIMMMSETHNWSCPPWLSNTQNSYDPIRWRIVRRPFARKSPYVCRCFGGVSIGRTFLIMWTLIPQENWYDANMFSIAGGLQFHHSLGNIDCLRVDVSIFVSGSCGGDFCFGNSMNTRSSHRLVGLARWFPRGDPARMAASVRHGMSVEMKPPDVVRRYSCSIRTCLLSIRSQDGDVSIMMLYIWRLETPYPFRPQQLHVRRDVFVAEIGKTGDKWIGACTPIEIDIALIASANAIRVMCLKNSVT